MQFPQFLSLLLLTTLTSCAGVRMKVDFVPADDTLQETIVLTEPSSGSGGRYSGGKIALIDVTGMILDARKPGLLVKGENMVSRFIESLQKAADDKKVKAIIIRLNSPGGAVTATDVLYREVLHFKQTTHKPVIAFMSDVAASGAFYLACSADAIIAHPTTVTGSIGVIIQTINFADGMKMIGLHAEAITSGPNKSMGSPFTPMPAAHRALLQGLVDEFYTNFKSIVLENRPNLDPAVIDQVTDGRVVTGKHAAEIGLIDQTGTLRDAFALARKHANLKSARLVKYHRPQNHVGSPYATAQTPGTPTATSTLQLNLTLPTTTPQSGFYYLWNPAIW